MISPVICAWRARLYCMRQLLDQLAGVLGGALHGHHAGDLLADRRVEEALEQPHLEAGRHDFFQDALGRRQELVLRSAAAGCLRVGAGAERAQRQQRLDRDAAAGRCSRTSCRPRRAGRACRSRTRRGSGWRALRLRRTSACLRSACNASSAGLAAELEAADAALAGDFEPALGHFRLQLAPARAGRPACTLPL